MDDTLNLLDDLDIDLPTQPGDGLPAADSASGSSDGAQFFGTYQLIQPIGVGGVAKVWRARHIHPGYANDNFAIKILHEEVSRDPTVVELFRGEAFVLSMLKHRNIVQTFEAGNEDKKFYIAMEYIDGRDLDNLALRCQKLKVPLPIPVVMHIVGEALRALAYAHELADADGNSLNLVHRDVNPANVFLSYDGRVKLGDFGVASIAAGRIEKEREVAGKLGYFAPEQLLGEDVDQRADLFSVGVMLFELLCGTRLFQAKNAEQLMRLNKKAKIPKPTKFNKDIPAGLEAIMLRALSRKPQDRYASGRDMLDALLAFIPPAAGMSLAVAALMRKAFLNEHIQELQMDEGLAGGKVTRGSGQLVGVLSTDERAQLAFNELLLSRGYRVEVHATPDTLGGSFAKDPPIAMLVDVCAPGFSPEACAQQIAKTVRPVPVVAVAESLDPKWIEYAARIGAVDLLFKPFNIERVLTAVRAAISGAVKKVASDGASASKGFAASGEIVPPRALLLSTDTGVIERITALLAERQYEVDVVPTPTEALRRTLSASHHCVIYDAHPASPSDRFFAAQIRSQPGVGLIPMLYLADREAHHMFAGVDTDRGAVRQREDPASVLIKTLQRLRGDTRLGRTFLRYPTAFGVEIRYGGRVFSGECVDVSRGGVMMSFGEQMPPVGTPVGLSLMPAGHTTAIQAKGRVARVELNQAEAGDNASKVGVEFESFAGPGATQYIAFIATLDNSGADSPRTIIMGPPPRLPAQD